MIVIFTLVFPFLLFQEPTGSMVQTARDAAAFLRVANERNSEVKRKLALDFEKKFPRSMHLPDVYIQLSRVLVSQSDFDAATQYAARPSLPC